MSVFEGGLVVSRAARRIDSFKTTIEELAEFVEHEPRLPAATLKLGGHRSGALGGGPPAMKYLVM